MARSDRLAKNPQKWVIGRDAILARNSKGWKMLNKNNSKLRRIIWRGLLAASASTIALTASTAVFAQNADQAAKASADVEEIVVTGSRIARINMDTVRPISEVGPDIISKRAATNLADAIKELPIAGFGIGPNGDQNAFTVGQSYVDLFNLGSQRTLTLVNGRRFVSSNVPSNFSSAAGLQVDYNVLPVALVQRIEVVPLAGAAVYGSDAIAGTINVVLNQNYQGAEFSSQYGRSYKKDLDQWQVQGVIGTNFAEDKGNVAFSVEYNKQDGALLNARPDWKDNRPLVIPFGARLDADGDGDKDQEYRIYYNQVAQIFGNYGSVSPTAILRPSLGQGAVGGKFYEFTATGDLSQCQPGQVPGASSSIFAMSATPGSICGRDLVGDTNQIRSPVERITISTLGHYDLPFNTRFFVESTFANAKAKELVNQGGFNTWVFGGTSGALTMNTANPFLSAQSRSILEGALGANANFSVNRLDNDLVAGGANNTQNFTWRVAPGFEGKFNIGERKFKWEVSSVFGHANILTSTLGIIDGRLVNALDAVRVDSTYLNSLVTATGSTIKADRNGDGKVDGADALIVLNASGQSGVTGIANGSIICRINGSIANGTVAGYNSPVIGAGVASTASTFGAGCLPLNIFGDAQRVNSRRALSFITGGPRQSNTNNDQRVLTANISGEVFKLPAGWINANVGVESRRENALFTPDQASTLGISRGGFATQIQTGGSYTTSEYFAEALVPLVSPSLNIPLINLLEVSGSIRSVKGDNKDINRLSDSSNDSTAFEYGGRWSPVKDLVFRGSYTEAIRAPSLVELYTPESGSFSSAQDPCDQRYINGGGSPAIRQANCVAGGLPANFTSIVVNQTIPITTSGNAGLIPEQSKAYTIGFVAQPRWIPGLVASLDYFNIDIENRISGLGLTQVLNACYDSPTYPTAPACSSNLFQRNAAGQISFGRTTSLNASKSSFQAYQGHASYGFDVSDALQLLRLGNGGDFGRLRFDGTLLRTDKNMLQVLNEVPTNPTGTFSQPKWKGTFDATYDYGDWRVFWRTLWQDQPVFLSTDGASYLVDLGPGQETTVATAANIVNNKLEDRFMHNMSIQYTWHEKTALQLSVNNVLDWKPSLYNWAGAAFYPGDQIGRYFVFRIRQKF